MNENNDNDWLDPENNSKCCFFKVANAFLLLANMLLIILGFHYLPTCLSEDSSYFSVIVAVLGILITVLITWQIWQTITTKGEINEIKKKADEAERNFNDLSNQIDIGLKSNRFYTNATRLFIEAEVIRSRAETSEDLREAYALYLEALVEYLYSDPTDFIERCLASMERCQTVGSAFDYDPEFNEGFVKRCDEAFDHVERLYGSLTKEQRGQAQRLHAIRTQYHNPNGTERK